MLAPWTEGMEAALGRKRVFLNAVFFGASRWARSISSSPPGFTLIFGLMRNVNLAHGSLYLLGGYLGYEISEATGSWLLAFPVVFVIVALLACSCSTRSSAGWRARSCARPWSPSGFRGAGRHHAVDLGRAKLHDHHAGLAVGPDELPIVAGTDRAGETVYLRYPRCASPS
jgi:branched-chain amino acid transport system permease protein